MTRGASPALSGGRLLVLASGDVEINHVRRLGFTEIAVTRRRPDGSRDERVGGDFDHALVVLPVDTDEARTAVAYAFERLTPAGVVQFMGPASYRPDDELRWLTAALPGYDVDIVQLPAPSTRLGVQVTRPTGPVKTARTAARRGWLSRRR